MESSTHEPVAAKIRKLVLEALEKYPNGIRFNELKREVVNLDPSLKASSVGYGIWNLSKDTSLISRTAKSTLALSKFSQAQGKPEDASKPATGIKEEAFYPLFAGWLSGSGDEATEAIAIGGAGLKSKWGTPDVVGVYKPKPSDLVKFDPVIISAEIKIDPTQSIVAFGQAISYRLFSHKTIIAMPSIIEDKLAEDHERLRSLCELFGVGYVVFDRDNLDDPDFRFLIPPRRFEPDMFYVNAFARRLLEIEVAHFDKLFQ